jgi:hypothetical protein
MDRRHPCRPPGIQGVPCIKPLPSVGRGFGNPTGGPGSSPWSNGNPAAAQPAATPAPCAELADLFTECFALCDGLIDVANQITVCGWSYNDQASPSGSILFVPGSMNPAADPSDATNVMKSIPTLIPTIFGVTAQWLFRESDDPSSASYVLLFTNDGNTEQLYIQIEAGGGFALEIGPVLAQVTFAGNWVSKPGALRKFSVVVDAVGGARVFVDDVEVPLGVFGTTSGRAGFQGNSAFVRLENNGPAPITFKMEKIFLANGAKGTTNFCCS